MNVHGSRAGLLLLAAGLALSGCGGGDFRYFDSDGTTIAYQVHGEGPTVVLVHGITGSGNLHWDFPGTVRCLERDFRVVTIDCRAHGRSDKPTDPEAYGLAMVEDVRRLLDHLGVERTGIAGYSMGSWITLKFALLYPERVWATAVGGGGWADFTPWLENGDKGLLLPIHEDFSSEALDACGQGFPEFQLSAAEVAALPAPLLVRTGGLDFARDQAARLAEARPDADYAVVGLHTHASMLFAPVFHRTLRDFFRSAAGP